MTDLKPLPCPQCSGRGYLDEYRFCSACHGSGNYEEPEPVDKHAVHVAWAKRISQLMRQVKVEGER